jgi:spore coat protein SA
MENQAISKKMRIAILLPRIEKWSSFHGGACARVVNKVISEPLFENEEILVFCKSCNTKYAYKNPWSQPKLSSLWSSLDAFFYKISWSLDGWAWIIPQYRKLKKFDLIHIYNRPHYGLILRKLGYKGKIIQHLQNDFSKSSKEFAKSVVDKSDLVISCSQKISDRFFENYPEGIEKARVLYNGGDISTFHYGGMEKRKKQILFMGRNDPIKGIDNLFKAYQKLLDTHTDLKLVLTGSAFFGDKHKMTNFEKKMFEQIKSINSKGGNIQHVGYVEYEELPQLLRDSQIFCLPSIVHDAFPLVVIEAMMTGTPVVASNLGGIPEILGEYGSLAEPNVESLFNALNEMLIDPELREHFSIKGYKRAKENFAWEIISRKQNEIYKTI